MGSKRAEKYTLKDMRDMSKLPIKVIEEESRISYRSIRNWEIGRNVPSLININDLLKVYGYTLDQLDMSVFYRRGND